MLVNCSHDSNRLSVQLISLHCNKVYHGSILIRRGLFTDASRSEETDDVPPPWLADEASDLKFNVTTLRKLVLVTYLE